MDMSSSIGIDNWDQYMVPFVVELIDQFAVGPDNAQFGLTTFSATGMLRWGLSDYSTNKAIIDAVKSMAYSGVS